MLNGANKEPLFLRVYLQIFRYESPATVSVHILPLDACVLVILHPHYEDLWEHNLFPENLVLSSEL